MAETDIRAASGITALRVIAAALFAGFNLLPLYGLVAWHWDASTQPAPVQLEQPAASRSSSVP